MRTIGKVALVTPVVLLLLVASLAILITGFPFNWFNDRRLDRFATNVYAHTLPPETTVLDRESRFGLFGNGNHCDYWVIMKMKSTISREAVLAHYEGMTFPPAWLNSPPVRDGGIPVHVRFPEQTEQGILLYVIDVMDAGYPAGADIRCH